MKRSGERLGVHVEVEAHPRFSAIYQATLEDGARRLATKNLVIGRPVYGERFIRYEGVEYRLWDAYRSKLAAAVLKNVKRVSIEPNHKVLYLGAASGTTVSHVSDIVGERGYVYCVEFAPRAIRDLLNNVCVYRSNMVPILEDARVPEKYSFLVDGKVDDIYCDIAQPEQAKVLADNADLFLRERSWVMLAVKAQSIDVTKEPMEVYKREVNVLESRGFQVEDVVYLEPYDKAHAMVVAQFR